MKPIWMAIDKIDDIVYRPIDVVCKWLEYPLQSMEDRRKAELSTDNSKLTHSQEMEKLNLEADLRIKMDTEKIKIITEIEEWQKDQDFERKKAVSEAIINYQRELTKINIDVINEIGLMQLELRKRAQDMIAEKTKQYKSLQKEAIQDAMDQANTVQNDFAEDSHAAKMLLGHIDKATINIIESATNFLRELNDDLKSVNRNIDLLSQNGQTFIEQHLQQFQSLGYDQQQIGLLKGPGN